MLCATATRSLRISATASQPARAGTACELPMLNTECSASQSWRTPTCFAPTSRAEIQSGGSWSRLGMVRVAKTMNGWGGPLEGRKQSLCVPHGFVRVGPILLQKSQNIWRRFFQRNEVELCAPINMAHVFIRKQREKNLINKTTFTTKSAKQIKGGQWLNPAPVLFTITLQALAAIKTYNSLQAGPR